jgi:ADP-heptose:LPS heptosyltransferase
MNLGGKHTIHSLVAKCTPLIPAVEPLSRILLMRNDRIGDLVLSLPAIEAVRRAWPRAHVALLVSRYAAPLLDGTPYLDELLLDDPAEEADSLGRRLAAMRFDAALVFNTNRRNCLAPWRAGIPRRVYWAYKPIGFLLGNRRVAVHRNRPPVHEAAFALAFVQRLGVDYTLRDLAPRLEIDPAVRHRVAARIHAELGSSGPLFGIHPGNGDSAFNWPAAHYGRLACRLARHGRVMITGRVAERPLLDAVHGQLDRSAQSRVKFYTDFELPELAAALSMQTVLTASSTGPMHVAGILGTPVVALFSPHPAHVPQKWAPLGRGHTLLVAPLEPGERPRIPRSQGTAVMSRISVEQALVANLSYVRHALPVGSEGGDRFFHRAASRVA